MDKLYSAKDFMNFSEKNIYETADEFQKIIDQPDGLRINPYNIETVSATGVKSDIIDPYSGESKSMTSFVSSNYLGLNKHEKVKEAIIQAVGSYGSGTCTTPLIGGFEKLHKNLEQQIAKLHGQEDAVLFSSGFSSNVGVMQSLFNKSDLVIVDTLVHASVYDGLTCTNVKLCKHNDTEYLEMVLKRTQGNYRNIAIVVDGVYSQEGDLGKLPEICTLAQKYSAIMIVDDAHGVGVLGKNGRGTCNYFNVEDKVSLITGTLSKALSSVGGYVAGGKQIIKYIRHYARPAIFSASSTPALVAGASKAIELLYEEPQIIEKLWSNTDYIKGRLAELGFDTGNSLSPIIPVMVRDDTKVMFIARRLFEKGIYIIPTVYPAVKMNNSRLRLNVSAEHSIEDLDFFCKTLLEVNEEYDFKIKHKL